MVAVVDETKTQKSDCIKHSANSETNSKSFGVDETACGKVHDGVDQEGDLDGEVGIGFGKIINFGHFARDGDDGVVG